MNYETKLDVTQGDNVILECHVKGDPKPLVEWRKDGRLILPQGLASGSSTVFNRASNLMGPNVVISPDGFTLTIYSVVDSMAGTFTCSAINVHAIESKEFQLTVKSKLLLSIYLEKLFY